MATKKPIQSEDRYRTLPDNQQVNENARRGFLSLVFEVLSSRHVMMDCVSGDNVVHDMMVISSVPWLSVSTHNHGIGKCASRLIYSTIKSKTRAFDWKVGPWQSVSNYSIIARHLQATNSASYGTNDFIRFIPRRFPRHYVAGKRYGWATKKLIRSQAT